MFKYVSDISILAQDIIKNYCTNFNFAIDATLGNGYDTDFLASYFNQVYSFDIQKTAIDNYSKKENNKVTLFHDSHEFLHKCIHEKVDCVMYNLGYLPGGDKTITTNMETTISSIKSALELVNSNGLITICVYNGHSEGKLEREALIAFVSSISKKEFGVMIHSFLNRNNAPELIVIEKK